MQIKKTQFIPGDDKHLQIHLQMSHHYMACEINEKHAMQKWQNDVTST